MKNVAEFILRGFESLKVPLNVNSRLAKQIDAYLDRKGELPQVLEPDHQLFQTAVEAHRDLNQVAYALMHLHAVVPPEELRERLRKIVDDPVLPQDRADHSPGRDAQCELFVAALCARAGLNPVFDESPDLRCELSGQTFGVAIKRIKAPPQRFGERFKQRIREAAEQVAGSRLPGIIISDISQSRNPENWRVPLEMSDSMFDSAWQADTVRFKQRFELPLRDWTRGQNVRGVILIDHILRCPPTRRWRMELMGFSINLCSHNQRRRREFESFDDRLKRAICSPGQVPTKVSAE